MTTMPAPAQRESLRDRETILALLVFVVAGPGIGMLVMAYLDGFRNVATLQLAYAVGLGPAATCAGLSLVLWRHLRTPLARMLASPLVGVVSGLVGFIPCSLVFFGVSLQASEVGIVQFAFLLVSLLSLAAATLCTGIIELARLTRA